MKENWRQKTLENLEKESWTFSGESSYLTMRCQQLSKLPLEKFTIEDLRIMIGQQFGLTYLIPLAIEILTNNLFAEGDHYEGDLLKSVLSIDTHFWHQNKNYWEQLNNLIKNRRNEVLEHKLDLTNFDKV